MKLASLEGKPLALVQGFYNVPKDIFKTDLIFIIQVFREYPDKLVLYYSTTGNPKDAYLSKIVSNTILVSKVNSRSKKGKELAAKLKEHRLNDLRMSINHWFSIGSDPEMFVVDSKKNTLIPAFNFLPSKEKGIVCPNTGDKLYWDGFQAEFTTCAVGCLQSQLSNIRYMLSLMQREALKYDKNAVISSIPTIDVDINDLINGKEEHVQFGCMPSFNIYGMKGVEMHGREVPFRSAGGHIHFGCGKLTETQLKNVMMALDAIIGVACVSLFAKQDNPRRRFMYGLAGEYRLPPHGLEYRTLSNSWLCHPFASNIVVDIARKAFMFGFQGLLDAWKATQEEVIECINTHNVEMAREILNRNKELFSKIIDSRYQNVEQTTVVLNTFMNGIESAINDPSDVLSNWNLNKDGTFKDSSGIYHHEVRHAVKTLITGKKVS